MAGANWRSHARHAEPRRGYRVSGPRWPVRWRWRMLLRVWVGVWAVGALLAAVGGTADILDPTETDRGDAITGVVFVVLVCLLFVRFGYRRLRARGMPRTTAHYAPLRWRLPDVRVRTDVSLGQLASLAVAERALGDALYRLDLARDEIGVDRSAVVAARATGLDAAAALRARTTAVPGSHLDAYRGLVGAVEALLAGTGSAESLRRATGRLAAVVAALAGGPGHSAHEGKVRE